MEVQIKNDTFISSIANELGKSNKDVVSKLEEYCKVNNVLFEPQDDGEKVTFIIGESINRSAMQVCDDVFGIKDIKIVLYLSMVTMETIGMCDACGGEILEHEIYKNDAPHDSYKQCEKCDARY